ncbi:helix-turn-helix domain-containing protein [Apilactobacillus sp. M161]|uniref:Helix-turn-helix domain-containing protein n=1 Tax=Apilactobacillus xinyiensis TaxID=2841032 RepID=A0ABT0I1E3_9LACO|nr:helix-turn-helix transcriptional regulator [Apilactobacillus xinyiensis]MCK8624533.1 helix-turn-helix domain-containing protein [Apilactobacillus xinyiensis]
MNFGQRLQNERIKNQLTQDEVANKLLVSRQTISSWENERTYPDINSLISLSDFYNISLDTLLKEDSGMKEYLEKNEIAKNLKPILKILTFVNILFMVTTIVKEFNIFNNSLFNLSTFVMGISNTLALFYLNAFMTKISFKKKSVTINYMKQHKYYSIGIIVTIFSIGLIVNRYNALVGGMFSGIASAGLVLVFISKKS